MLNTRINHRGRPKFAIIPLNPRDVQAKEPMASEAVNNALDILAEWVFVDLYEGVKK